MAVTVKSVVLSDDTPCGLVNRLQKFRRNMLFPSSGNKTLEYFGAQGSTETSSSAETNHYLQLTILPTNVISLRSAYGRDIATFRFS
jgi:hypothetical protein